tara:strand:+ start:193 stop:372 length:180 start_codon:yes stop_codon:yes gene_type:complete
MNKMSKINLKTATIDELEDECDNVQGTNYGHNIIGIICRVVKDRFGVDEADRLFDTYQN